MTDAFIELFPAGGKMVDLVDVTISEAWESAAGPSPL
jgi:hypothetical protein